MSPVELVEEDVDVRVRKHQRSLQIVSGDETIAFPFGVLGFEETERLLNVKVCVLEEQLSLLLDDVLRLQDLLP